MMTVAEIIFVLDNKLENLSITINFFREQQLFIIFIFKTLSCCELIDMKLSLRRDVL